jgi:hypothetical protein
MLGSQRKALNSSGIFCISSPHRLAHRLQICLTGAFPLAVPANCSIRADLTTGSPGNQNGESYGPSSGRGDSFSPHYRATHDAWP